MSTKHTPVPWKAEKSGIYDAEGYCVVRRHPQDDGRYGANAAFIVRARNNHDALLAAAKRVLQGRCLSIDFDHNRTLEALDLRAALDAAITNAEKER